MHIPLSTSEFAGASGALTAMKVNENKTAKLFHMMSSTLYTDKFMSILRELSSNARDSHAEAGKLGTPFAIIAPSHNHLKLVVSDAGTGITYELATQTILEFLSSTKDEGECAKDFIGGWGIGAKTPRAYADNYQVHLRKDGTEWFVQVINDAAGMPQQMLMSEHKTSKPNGVDFIVPIQPVHVDQWRNKVRTYIAMTNYNVIGYMGDGEVIKSEKPFRTYDFGYFALDVHGEPESRGSSAETTVSVVYGGAVYQIPWEFGTSALQTDITTRVKKGLKVSLRFDIPNSIKCGLSREHMEVDEGNKNLLVKALMAVGDDLKLAAGENVAYPGKSYENYWTKIKADSDAMVAALEEGAKVSRLTAISSSKTFRVTWCPEGLITRNYSNNATKREDVDMSLPLEEGYVPTVHVKYSDKAVLRSDLYYSSNANGLMLEYPDKTLDEDKVREWAESLPHYRGVNFTYQYVESTRTTSSRSKSSAQRLSYVICDVTKKRHNLSTRHPVVAVPSKADLWVGMLDGTQAFVPTKSLKYRQIEEGCVIQMADYLETRDAKRALEGLRGAFTDDATMYTLRKAFKVTECQTSLPQSVQEWVDSTRKELDALWTVAGDAKEVLKSIEEETGKSTVPDLPLEGVDEALKEANRLYVFLEKNLNLFKVVDFDRVVREHKEGNPEAMRLVFAMQLEQYL